MEAARKVVREIVLNQKEQELFGLLREVLHKNNLNTTLRVAGGWVRDKVTQNADLSSDLSSFLGWKATISTSLWTT